MFLAFSPLLFLPRLFLTSMTSHMSDPIDATLFSFPLLSRAPHSSPPSPLFFSAHPSPRFLVFGVCHCASVAPDCGLTTNSAVCVIWDLNTLEFTKNEENVGWKVFADAFVSIMSQNCRFTVGIIIEKKVCSFMTKRRFHTNVVNYLEDKGALSSQNCSSRR